MIPGLVAIPYSEFTNAPKLKPTPEREHYHKVLEVVKDKHIYYTLFSETGRFMIADKGCKR
jgi:hypothetical protein